MRGLLLTNYYLVYKSFFAYAGLAIFISAVLVYFGDHSMHRMAAMLIILLVAMPALEVIKHESKSEYDKYVLTLPVNRRHIVQSHYTFYFLIIVIGAALAGGFFTMYNWISNVSITGIFNIVSFGIFIVLFSGAIVYPLLYIFGAEKSDAIVIGGAMAGLVATFLLQGVVGYIVQYLSPSYANPNTSLYIPVIYIGIGFLLYVMSHFISVFIYSKKQF